jgi:hypothetical protein
MITIEPSGRKQAAHLHVDLVFEVIASEVPEKERSNASAVLNEVHGARLPAVSV